jgi:3-oxoacyl-(acyl-carrier-protein) synthase
MRKEHETKRGDVEVQANHRSRREDGARDSRRVVITGLGVLAPNGSGKEAFWQACLEGRSGIGPITRFDASVLPTRIAGEINDFLPDSFGLNAVERTTLDRGSQFAIATATMALADASMSGGEAFSDDERLTMGVYIGTAMASVSEAEQRWVQSTEGGSHPPDARVHPDGVVSLIPRSAAAVASHHGLGGPCLSIATGCSAGADAIGQAFWKIQDGYTDRMLAGGTDAAISLLGLNVFSVLRALSTRNDEPERASRPYDNLRDGFVLAEGAAMLLLEEREAALARGAHIYAEIVGYATNSNASHMTSLPENGISLQKLIQQLLVETELPQEQIGYINSHGSSTDINDVAESAAYKGCFGEYAYKIPISATKSMIGHTQGAASAIEMLVTALALERQVLPPTINQKVPDPDCDLDYVPNVARSIDAQQALSFALTHSSGFGGVNSALILARYIDDHLHDPHERIAQDLGMNHQRRASFSSAQRARRVVVTGLGMVTPSGIGKQDFWSAMLQGHSSVGPIKRSSYATFAPQCGGELSTFHAEDYLDRKLIHRTDRMTHFALAAVQHALMDASLQPEMEDPARIGAVIANTLGGMEYATRQLEVLYQRGPRFMSAYTAIAWLHIANVGQSSIRYNLRGYGKTPVNDLSGGLDALGLSYEAIRRGAADVLLTGGSEAPLQLHSWHPLGAASVLGTDLAACAYRPFDLRAEGPLLAEGAGICIMEDYEHARRRDARIYGEVVGYVQAHHAQNNADQPNPGVDTYIRALYLLLDQADLAPQDIGCIYLDGRALSAWDAAETQALRQVFGSSFDSLPCSVPRSQFGHSLAAAGALDAICAFLSLQQHTILPTLNCEEPDLLSCPPLLVRDHAYPQDQNKRAALVCTRSLSGSHSLLAVKTL